MKWSILQQFQSHYYIYLLELTDWRVTPDVQFSKYNCYQRKQVNNLTQTRKFKLIYTRKLKNYYPIRIHIYLFTHLEKNVVQSDSWCWVLLPIGVNLIKLFPRLRNLDSVPNVMNICTNRCNINNEWTV